MKKPLISIITVVYNDIANIETTINSVITQTYDKLDYIIIDGNSTDGTVDIIKKYEKKVSFWLSEDDQGIYDAMNKGVRYANGEYVCFMNCGDTFYNSQVIENLLSYFLLSIDVVYGSTCSIQDIGPVIVKGKNPKYLLVNMPFCHQSSFVRRQCLLDNPFDLNYKYVADYNFFYNSYTTSKSFVQTDIIIAVYNAIDGISAKNKKEVFYEILKVRKKTDTLLSKIALYIKYYRCISLENLKKRVPSLVLFIRKMKLKL